MARMLALYPTCCRHLAVYFLLALIGSTSAYAQSDAAETGAVLIKITGVTDEQLAAVKSALSLSAYENRSSIGNARFDRLVKKIQTEAPEALQAFGYYQAKAVVTTDALNQRPRRVEVTFFPGDPVRVRFLDIAIQGAAARNERISAAVKNFHPAQGEIFNHAIYETNKAQIERALQRRGYFDQEIMNARVAINRAENYADITLHWNSGTRYLLGEITFTGGQFDDVFLHRYIPWRNGDRYDQRRIEALQQEFSASGYFSSIEVVPEIENSSELHVPITVNLTPAKRSAYRFGASYDTEYGIGARFGLDRRWVNHRGHTFASEAEITGKLWSTTLDYRLPHSTDAQRFYLLGARYRDEQTEAVDATSTLYSVGMSRASDSWNTTLSLNALQGSFLVGTRDAFDERQHSTVIYPELNGMYISTTNRVRPQQGASLRMEVRGGSEVLGSDVNFSQIRTEARWIYSFNPETRILLRGELGATRTDQFSLLPPELRFFAGGDRSVRGYGYQSLGNRDAEGTPIGGRYLSTASVELEKEFRPRWSAAAFMDVGDVFSQGRPHLSRGVGLGIRWASPVGPIRLDIGHGLNNPDSSFELHISAGPDL